MSSQLEDLMRTIHSTTWCLPLAIAIGMGCSHTNTGAKQPPATGYTTAGETQPPGSPMSGVTGSTTPNTGSTQPQGSSMAGATSPEVDRQRREQMDPARALLRAARDLQPGPDQTSKIAGFEQQLESNEKEMMAPFQTFNTDLAAQVRAGQIDKTKIQADETAIVSALQKHVAKESEILTGLHAVLAPDQRKAAVASVRAREPSMPERQARMGEAHGGGPQDMAKRRLDRKTAELGLDTAQQEQVAKWLAEEPRSMRSMYEEKRKRRDTLFTAFESNTFDATAVAPPNMGAEVREHLDRHVAFLSKLVPILRPDRKSTRLNSSH